MHRHRRVGCSNENAGPSPRRGTRASSAWSTPSRLCSTPPRSWFSGILAPLLGSCSSVARSPLLASAYEPPPTRTYPRAGGAVRGSARGCASDPSRRVDGSAPRARRSSGRRWGGRCRTPRAPFAARNRTTCSQVAQSSGVTHRWVPDGLHHVLGTCSLYGVGEPVGPCPHGVGHLLLPSRSGWGRRPAGLHAVSPAALRRGAWVRRAAGRGALPPRG